jgi:hypothetical protein
MKVPRWCVTVVALGVLTATQNTCGGEVLPAPQTSNIHTTGDTVSFGDGTLTVIVPPQGISEDGGLTAAVLGARSVPASALLVSTSAYDLSVTPSSLRLLKPWTVLVRYAGFQMPSGVRGQELRLHRVTGGGWQPVAGGINDAASGTVSASVTDVGRFGLLGLPVRTLAVTPSTVTVGVGATQLITATARDSLGNVLPDRGVSFTTSAPATVAVSGSGVVTGVAPGSAHVTVTSETRSVQVPVTVTSGPVSTSRSLVSVSWPTVAVGGTVTLALQAKDAAGSDITTGGLVVAFSVSGGTSAGTIGPTTDNGDGSYTATFTATAAGTATSVHATIGGAAVTSTLPTLTVTSGGTAFWPNEPPGFTKFTERAFNSEPPNGPAEDGWTSDYLPDPSGVTIVTDPSAPYSPPNVGQALFYTGFPSGSGPVDAERYLTGTSATQLYISFWLKFSSNWYGNGSSVNKIFFIWIHDAPAVYFQAYGSGNGPLIPLVTTQNTPADHDPWWGNQNSSVQVVRGAWQRWEVLLVCNTAGNADGVLKWWVDGTLIGSYNNVQYASASQGHTWQTVAWNPTYGGGGPAVPADQYQWIDHIYVSLKP